MPERSGPPPALFSPKATEPTAPIRAKPISWRQYASTRGRYQHLCLQGHPAPAAFAVTLATGSEAAQPSGSDMHDRCVLAHTSQRRGHNCSTGEISHRCGIDATPEERCARSFRSARRTLSCVPLPRTPASAERFVHDSMLIPLGTLLDVRRNAATRAFAYSTGRGLRAAQSRAHNGFKLLVTAEICWARSFGRAAWQGRPDPPSRLGGPPRSWRLKPDAVRSTSRVTARPNAPAFC